PAAADSAPETIMGPSASRPRNVSSPRSMRSQCSISKDFDKRRAGACSILRCRAHILANFQKPSFNRRDMPRPSPSQSAEDYLERIHELIEQKGYARVVDIASSLK